MSDREHIETIMETASRENRWLGPQEAAPSRTIVDAQLTALAEAGYSIVRTNDHVSRTSILKSVEIWEDDEREADPDETIRNGADCALEIRSILGK